MRVSLRDIFFFLTRFKTARYFLQKPTNPSFFHRCPFPLSSATRLPTRSLLSLFLLFSAWEPETVSRLCPPFVVNNSRRAGASSALIFLPPLLFHLPVLVTSPPPLFPDSQNDSANPDLLSSIRRHPSILELPCPGGRATFFAEFVCHTPVPTEAPS